ncbi:MAG: ABC transporter substrate-binding protein [Rhodospirillales bacterium]|nr:ABC transporter substrate-binding protein [Rhodospirillales bacterium]
MIERSEGAHKGKPVRRQSRSVFDFDRRSLLLAAAAALILGTGVGRQGYAADSSSQAAEAWLETFIAQGLSLLQDRTASPEQQSVQLRRLVDEYFALDATGRWILGRHWNQASEAEREEFLALFKDFIVYGYVTRFSEYSGQRIQLVRSIENGDGSVSVQSLVDRAGGGQPIEVQWRVSRGAGGTSRITDVVIENVSLSQTYRSEFGSSIQQGGSVEKLNAMLRERVAQQKSELGIGN